MKSHPRRSYPYCIHTYVTITGNLSFLLLLARSPCNNMALNQIARDTGAFRAKSPFSNWNLIASAERERERERGEERKEPWVGEEGEGGGATVSKGGGWWVVMVVVDRERGAYLIKCLCNGAPISAWNSSIVLLNGLTIKEHFSTIILLSSPPGTFITRTEFS